MPVLNSEGEVIGVAEIMNKTDGTEAFTSHDEAVGTPTTIIFTFQAIKLPLLLLLFYRLLPSVIIGCSPPLFATHTTSCARSSPLSSPDGLAYASELIHLPYP